jgi:hypothetical protein
MSEPKRWKERTCDAMTGYAAWPHGPGKPWVFKPCSFRASRQLQGRWYCRIHYRMELEKLCPGDCAALRSEREA